ncbi:YoaK family protein [Lutimaribacter marinistellae]|uniref:YoaK family protein n=1 Tax=Lutimaribacter marinistellae TaxID=1820329 RepID=A0ABV7TI18_9RHOB
MLILEGDARSAAIDLRLAALLSAVAGALNATGFEEAGLFSANMTGNVSALADSLALRHWGVAALFISVVAVFVTGATVAGVAIEHGRKRQFRGVYAAMILTEALFLVTLGIGGMGGWTLSAGMPLIFMLSVTLGWQNAVTTRISAARVRTTHVSGMATDMGLALAGLWVREERGTFHRGQIILHSVTIGSFLLGGVAGAICHLRLGAGVFLACGLPLGCVSMLEFLRARRD